MGAVDRCPQDVNHTVQHISRAIMWLRQSFIVVSLVSGASWALSQKQRTVAVAEEAEIVVEREVVDSSPISVAYECRHE